MLPAAPAVDVRPRHWPALDGIRAVAVCAVLVYHWNNPHLLPGGYLGVDLFFILSGFLITWGITLEWDRSDPRRGPRFSARHFYARRALRLGPALAAVLVFVAVLLATSLHGPLAHQTVAGIPWVVLFVGNWSKALQFGNLGVLNNLWSLGVEEQFYLLWPAVAVLLLRRGWRRERLGTALLCVAGAEAVYREALYRSGVTVERLAFGLDTHSDGLLVGCALAMYLSAGRLPQLNRRALAGGAWLAVVVVAVLMVTGNGRTSFQWGYPLTAVAGGTLIAACVTGRVPALAGVLSSRPAVWIGRRSYGLYVWSFPIYVGLPWPASFNGYPRYAAETALSFVVAGLSYRFVELPFLRRKKRLGSIDAPAPEPRPAPAAAPGDRSAPPAQ